MTLKYESEILFDLMKRDGDDTPSNVLPYESELKEKYLQQVEGAYPKLQDYRSEWLNYNLNAHIPADFPVESVSNVTNATFENVVPYAYESAILKGQTLVNCINQKDFKPIYVTRVEIDNGYVYTQDGYNNSTRIELNYTSNPLLSNEKYYLISFRLKINKQRTVNVVTDGTGYEDYSQRFSEADIFIKAKIKFAPNGTKLRIYVRCENDLDYTDDTFEIRELMLIEYQDGMENWDIPYFEGMQSVKMPVLTTSNEDGTKTNILTVNEDVTLRGIGDVQDKLDCLTGEVTESIGEIVLDGTQDMVSDGYGVYIQVDDVKRFLDYTDKIACDKLPVIPSYWDLENVENGISGFTNSSSYLGQNWLYVKINNSVNTDEVKEWLTQKPITVQYQLAQESIKTVDLTSTDQDGNTESIIRPIEGTMHVSTSSQTLPPLLDMSVPVEATSQNLMSFANIIEEEK